ncbi:hypothetical protein AB0M43_00030 [Longispora sp. NPDC051575]|uniref:hypothetical protein n=1 Tax=Longispora sp. NPDC051575 TaxID=3154943 RepID=UPI00341FB4EA
MDYRSDTAAHTAVAQQLGIKHRESVREWVRMAELNGGVLVPNTNTDRIYRLLRENLELRRANETLKMVIAEFSADFKKAAHATTTPGTTEEPPRPHEEDAFLSDLTENEDNEAREKSVEGLDATARQGAQRGRTPVVTDAMLHTLLSRRAAGETIEAIQPDLIILTGKRRGQTPSLTSIFRALAAHAKTQSDSDPAVQGPYESTAMSADG